MAKRLEVAPGTRFGRLVYIRDGKPQKLPSGQKPRTARCKCDCGRVANILLLHLVRGRIQSCGCLQRVRKRKPVVGNIYGELTVIKELNDKSSNGRMLRWVRAKCKCGKIGSWRLDVLRYMKSCGCLTAGILRGTATTHGLGDHPLYSHWGNMKTRCYNKKAESYAYCGANGVIVCDEWRYDFVAFYNWAIENGWEEGLTLDRYPNTRGNYEPSNCRWATEKQQANNKTNNVLHEYNGEKDTLGQLAEKYGFDYKLAHRRLHLGWPVKDAIEKPKAVTNSDQ